MSSSVLLPTPSSLATPASTHTTITATITPPATLTNLGALLTPITLPPGCLQTLYDMNTPGLGIVGSQSFFTQGCALSSCCPLSKAYTTGYGWLSSYHSPAVCPVSYQVCSGPAEVSPTRAGEVVAFCCPDTFQCPQPLNNYYYAETWYACFSTVTASSSVIQIDNIFNQAIVGNSIISAITASGEYAHYAVIAYPLQIRWRSEDFTTATSISSGASSSTGNSNGNGNGLNKGWIVGIIVGAVVGGLAILVFLSWFISRERQRATRAQAVAASSREPEVGQPEAARHNKMDGVESAERKTTSDGENQVSITTVESFPANFDRGIGMRRACLVGLALAWILGAALLAAGAYFCSYGISQSLSFSSSSPSYVPELLRLVFNIIITMINEIVGYTHTACLRWALQTENRLEFNSNLRLLSNSRTSKPNSWYSNIIFMICLALSYSTSAQLLQYTFDPSATYSSSSGSSQSATPTILAVNSVALTTLGVALLGQAAIATWAFCTNTIPTWSSSPLDTLKVAQEIGNLQHIPGRCMRSVDQKSEPSIPALPRPHQCSAWSAHKEVRWVLLLLFALLPLGGIWVGVCYSIFNGVDFYDSSGSFANWAFLPKDEEHTTSDSPYIALSWDNGNRNTVSAESLAFFTSLQMIVTLALHCVELLVNLSRDEAIWRRATTAPGLKVSVYNSVTAAVTAWQTAMLFLFKAAVHWIFGLSIAITTSNILLHPIQTVYLMILVAVLGALTTYIATRRPSGPQPAAYGHLQTMADLIDEWAPIMYWGDKSISGEYHAGTSGSVLGDVDLNCLYS